MNNEIVKRQIRELCQAPGPERKEEFFRQLNGHSLQCLYITLHKYQHDSFHY